MYSLDQLPIDSPMARDRFDGNWNFNLFHNYVHNSNAIVCDSGRALRIAQNVNFHIVRCLLYHFGVLIHYTQIIY